jgi:hypothetical protein
MGEWTILYNGDEKRMADWGLSEMHRERMATGSAMVSLEADGRAVDAMDLFDYGSTVIVYRDRLKSGGVWGGGVRWFYGRVDPWERDGSPESERHNGVLVNGWWYFREKNFEQIVKNFGGYIDPHDPSKGFIQTDYSSPHIFLNTLLQADIAHPDGKITCGEQITAVLQWLISEGAPIQIGTIGLDFKAPVDEIRNTNTCEEIMQKMWRWAPDTLFLWDYTTLPYPTFHCKQAKDLDAYDVMLEGRPLTHVKLRERVDWKRPFVRIVYEQENDGFLQVTEDVWPNPLPAEKFGGFVTNISLAGTQTVTQKATINTALIDESNLEWWKARFGWMNDASVSGLTIVSGSTTRESLVQEDGYDNTLNFEALDGSNFPEWLFTKKNVRAQRIRVSCKMTWIEKAGSKPKDRVVNYELTATNGAGDYTDRTITAVGDPQPIGLAKVIYDALHAIAFDGTMNTREVELTGLLDDWKVLNFLTPEQPTWASARVLPQLIEENAYDGIMSVQFGAPQHLSANDMVELQRVTRSRLVLNIISRQGGASSGTTVHLGKKSPTKNSSDGGGYFEKLVVSEIPDPGTNLGKGLITQDAPAKQFAIQGGASEGSIKLRLHVNEEGTNKGKDMAIWEFDVCVTNPATGKKEIWAAMFHASKPYPKS